MDPSYYDRQAASERKRLEGFLKARANAETVLARAEQEAARAEQSATTTSSASMRRSKLSEAQRKRAAANSARATAAKESTKAAGSQVKIHEHERKAAQARQLEAKREASVRIRDEQRARSAAAQEARQRRQVEQAASAQQAAQEREVSALRERTSDLEDQLGRARLAAPKQMTVLLMAGTIEGGRKPLRLDREIREIVARIRASPYRDQIRFETIQATQVRDVIDALNRTDPDVVHFSGHGGPNALLFEGADGEPHELSNEQLALLLQVARRPIRVAIFNACVSTDQAALATEYVSVAIGMQESIGDEAAKEFAGQFYASLGAGNSVASAFEQASAQAKVLELDGPGRPRLFERPGVAAAEMVLVAPA